MRNEQTKDRRVERTQGLLRAALASLLHEKPYARIVVKEILARANVGRSTFYAHFRDKDELLVTGIREIIRAGVPPTARGSMNRQEAILWFSRPILEHIERQRATSRSKVDAQGHALVHSHLERVLVDLIATELRRACSQNEIRGMPMTLLSQHVAATFVVVLNWWLQSSDPVPAQEANDRFRALIRPVLVEVLA